MTTIVELTAAEINEVTGAAHCGIGFTSSPDSVGWGFWFDGNEDGIGVTIGWKADGGGIGPGYVTGQDPVDPLFVDF